LRKKKGKTYQLKKNGGHWWWASGFAGKVGLILSAVSGIV